VSDPRRFIRQILLPEIGEEGQSRIESSVAVIGGAREGPFAGRLSGEVAERYARAAGFASVVSGPIAKELLAPPSIARSDAAREVLAGARAAVQPLRLAAGLKEPDSAADPSVTETA
jgi:hypothetical protein